MLALGFFEAKSDTSLFIYRQGSDVAYLLLYVDDIVLTASSSALLQQTISALQREFAMKDLGQLHFLGLTVEQRPDNIFLQQWYYILDILERAGMTDCNPCSTPVDTQAKVSATEGPPVADPTMFSALLQQTISALQREFAMKDLGQLHHFLGLTVEQRPDSIFLQQ